MNQYSKIKEKINYDLFLYNDTAKIENFEALPEYQHRRIGTKILKYLVDTALNKGAKTIYLTADVIPQKKCI